MSIPRVKFTNIALSKEVDWIHGFLFQNKWDWGKYIIKKHPKIKEVLLLKSETEQIKFLKKYISDFRKINQQKIEKNKTRYEKKWREIENDFFTTVSKTMQTDWPQNKKLIKAMISLNPICPRFLADWSFSIFYDYKKISYAIEVIMHESCHFLYFEKWKNVFPEAKEETFDYPYIEWHLSELIAPVILNDKHIQKLLNQKAEFYSEHNRIKIENLPAPKYFSRLYNVYTKQNRSFEEFLKEAYRIIKIHKKKFLNL